MRGNILRGTILNGYGRVQDAIHIVVVYTSGAGGACKVRIECVFGFIGGEGKHFAVVDSVGEDGGGGKVCEIPMMRRWLRRRRECWSLLGLRR